MNNFYTWSSIAVIALVTALIRFLPFLIFSDKTKTPKIIDKIGSLLPYSIMGMLLVYCLKDTQITTLSSVLPALISCFVVSLFYVWKRNTIISIVCGTLSYMFFVQIVF